MFTKKNILIWLITGATATAAYFSRPIQQRIKNGEALAAFDAANTLREKALALSITTRTAETDATAAHLWSESLAKCRTALKLLDPAETAGRTQLQVREAEALAQTGHADEAFASLTSLESKSAGGAEGEDVQAAIAEVSYQIALMVRAEDNVDDRWARYAEKSLATYQELLRKNPAEPMHTIYQQNIACVAQFLFNPSENDKSMGMPALKTVNCRKKMVQLARQQKNGGASKPEKFETPPDDRADPLREESLKKTQTGQDQGK